MEAQDQACLLGQEVAEEALQGGRLQPILRSRLLLLLPRLGPSPSAQAALHPTLPRRSHCPAVPAAALRGASTATTIVQAIDARFSCRCHRRTGRQFWLGLGARACNGHRAESGTGRQVVGEQLHAGKG